MESLVPSKRFTVVCDSTLQSRLIETFLELGALGYTLIDCRGRGNSQSAVAADMLTGRSLVKIEMIVPTEVAQRLLDYLRAEIFDKHRLMAYLEDVRLAEGDVY